MKLVLHDLNDKDFNKLTDKISKDTKVLSKTDNIKKCIGCFSCWIKTPGKCILHDDFNQLGQLLSTCNEVIIITKCCYGSYSPFIKNVLDRSISYVLPFFKIKNNEMHHVPRYDNKFNLFVFAYGQTSKTEIETLNSLVKRNAINLSIDNYHFKYSKDIFNDLKLKEVL